MISPGTLNEWTRMVLVNAIYFKGMWETQFKKTATRQLPFHKMDGTDKQTDFMTRKGTYGYAELEEAQVLEMPYKGNTLSMIIVLPNVASNIKRIEDSLSFANFNAWMSKINSNEVVVTIPKYKMDFSAILDDPLKAMGMGLAFDKDRADFSKMDRCRPGKCDEWLYLSKGIHKAFIAVDEDGTEAAAATAFLMNVAIEKFERSPLKFIADRPFLFFIREKSGNAVLFMGRLVAP